MSNIPTKHQLSAWKEEADQYMSETGRKVFPSEVQDRLFSAGALRCCKCHEVKVIDEFLRNRSKRNGMEGTCKLCMRAANAESHVTYRESRLEYKREYDRENADQKHEYNKNYRAENLGDLREYDRDYYLQHPWTRALYSGYVRAVDAGNEADWITESELLAHWLAVGINPDECFYSGVPIIHGETRSLDHEVPISEGGGHTLANLRPAHISMNGSKGKKRAVEWVIRTQPGTKTKEITV